MSLRRQVLVGSGAAAALLMGGVIVGAQSRFEPVTRDTLSALPGLQIITVRDRAQAVCYTVFMIESSRVARDAPAFAPPNVQDAAAARDRRLNELSAEFERALPGARPAMVGPDPLKYAWEGQKAQSEFERALRENEFRRLADWLEQIATGPRLAVAGPVPCSATPASPEPHEPHKE